MATEKQKRLQSAAMKTGYTINTLGEGKASRAENNIRQVARTRARAPGGGVTLEPFSSLYPHTVF